MKLPDYPAPGESIPASWGRQVVDYLRGITLRSSASVKVSAGSGGTTCQAMPAERPRRESLPPLTLFPMMVDVDPDTKVPYVRISFGYARINYPVSVNWIASEHNEPNDAETLFYEMNLEDGDGDYYVYAMLEVDKDDYDSSTLSFDYEIETDAPDNEVPQALKDVKDEDDGDGESGNIILKKLLCTIRVETDDETESNPNPRPNVSITDIHHVGTWDAGVVEGFKTDKPQFLTHTEGSDQGGYYKWIDAKPCVGGGGGGA